MKKPQNRDYDKRTRPFTFRVDPETHREVVAYAQSEGISFTEAIKTFVEWGLETIRLGKSTAKLKSDADQNLRSW